MGIRRGSISTPIIADGLVFNMDPANQASYPKTGTIVTDTINRVSSGSLESDPTFAEDIAFNYDGIDDYMLVGPSVSLSENWAISWWYKNTSGGTPSGYRNFMGGGGAFRYGLTMNSGVWKTYTAASPTWEPMSNSLTDGNWHNLTGVYNSSAYTWTSYQNGQFFKTFTPSGTTIGYQNFASSNFSKIGSYNPATQRFTLGSIGIVYAYNRILSSNEVLHNYNALKSRFE
tara:strand:+ start:2092 stop:2781 length:690 start_codon:yes stop_codon:yes gene_type:complete